MSYMTSRESHLAHVGQDAAAIARWDDEGGAAMTAGGNRGARASNRGSRLTAASPADLTVDQAPGDDKKILECLGAGPSSCDGARFRPKSNGSCSKTRLPWLTSRTQRRRRDRSRASCIMIRMMATRRSASGSAVTRRAAARHQTQQRF